MDIIFLSDLRIETVIGIFDWEREIKQTVIFDLEMGADIKRAASTDHIDDTLAGHDRLTRLGFHCCGLPLEDVAKHRHLAVIDFDGDDRNINVVGVGDGNGVHYDIGAYEYNN